MPPSACWLPTHAHLRAIGAGAALATLAVVTRRADLLVLGLPFIGAAAWGARHRPRAVPHATVELGAETLFEGQVAMTTVRVDGGETGDVVTACLGADPTVRWRPRSAVRAVAASGGPTTLEVGARALRWGRHSITLDAAACTSRLGAFRTDRLADGPAMLVALPLRADFDAADAMPRPAGLVGLHRAHRQGGGREPAEVRPFRTGDRLRRINWRVSSRTGALHVTSTWADRDSHVLLLLDTEADLGSSDGIDGRASSLDIAVRAAAAVAEHFLRAGDRVALIDLGRRVREVPIGSGRRHLRRVLDTLVLAAAGASPRAEPVQLRPTAAGALVVVFSPLIGWSWRAQIAHLARHGHTVVVVDTLPSDVEQPTACWNALASRVRVMERAADIDRLTDMGVPVVTWRGRGTLDVVLRDVNRLAGAPRGRR